MTPDKIFVTEYVPAMIPLKETRLTHESQGRDRCARMSFTGHNLIVGTVITN